MAWFDDLKTAVPDFYPGGARDTIVGYLRGDASPSVWRSMERTSTAQMLILGSVPPTPGDWSAAGVAQRGMQATIQIADLTGFIVLYGGFMFRPWGKIYTVDDDATRTFPSSVVSWRREYDAWVRRGRRRA
ncbi:MAG: hypothetical protein IPK81_11915 [Rhodospirillales bacterium]|nr:hypothetical protein [Rhodospirillales bacterium]QQS14789.1 MAG: hypothetical protein IPK81_11915 [Rhodospirillales bacterium]